jgi:hypothetical protein
MARPFVKSLGDFFPEFPDIPTNMPDLIDFMGDLVYISNFNGYGFCVGN